MQNITVPVDHLTPLIAHSETSEAPLMLSGGTGIGKSEFVEAYAATSGRLCCTKIFASMTEADIALAGPRPGDNFIRFLMNEGIPFVGTEDKWLHPTTRKPPVFFADELSNVVNYMQSVILQLFGERSFHGIRLIPGTILIAAGNRTMDSQLVSKMSAPLQNRLVHINVDPPTVDGFKSYCIKKGVNEFVPAYIDQTGGERLYRDYNPEVNLADPGRPTPRIWVRGVSPILDNSALDDSQRLALIAGCVGFGEANDFEVFLRLRKELPNMDQIFQTGKGLIPKNVSTRLLLIAALVRRCTPQNVANVFNYISTLAAIDPEWGDLFEKNLFIKDPTFAGHPAYHKWVLQMNRKPIQNVLSQTQPPSPSPTNDPTPSLDDILKANSPAPTIQIPVAAPKRRI